jgi:hypothetical protein
MALVWKSKGGIWRNSRPQGKGELYDSKRKILRMGEFDSLGKLSGQGVMVDFNGEVAFIFEGNFESDQKSGDFTRYSIPKANWDEAFVSSPNAKPVSSNKENCTYDDNVFTTLTSTNPVVLSITIGLFRGVNVSSFSYVEV